MAQLPGLNANSNEVSIQQLFSYWCSTFFLNVDLIQIYAWAKNISVHSTLSSLALFTPCHLTIIDQIHVKRYGIDEFFPSTVPVHSEDFAKIILAISVSIFSFKNRSLSPFDEFFSHRKWNWRGFPLDCTRSQCGFCQNHKLFPFPCLVSKIVYCHHLTIFFPPEVELTGFSHSTVPVQLFYILLNWF